MTSLYKPSRPGCQLSTSVPLPTLVEPSLTSHGSLLRESCLGRSVGRIQGGQWVGIVVNKGIVKGVRQGERKGEGERFESGIGEKILLTLSDQSPQSE